MSDLIKIVYEVAAVRSDYLRIHRRVFHVSAGRLMHNLTRRHTRGSLTDQQELEELSQRLSRAIDGLSNLNKEDLSIRRGREIQNELSAYAQALTESMAALATLLEVRKRPRNGSHHQPSGASRATKTTYDDAVQYHKRLGARLNELLTTL
jgi:small-conductance mechanosensitive channel